MSASLGSNQEQPGCLGPAAAAAAATAAAVAAAASWGSSLQGCQANLASHPLESC